MYILDPFLTNNDGKRVTIQSKYHRGEVKIRSDRSNSRAWAVDGYAETDHGAKVYEFNGDYWHHGCPFCSDGDMDTHFRLKMRVIQEQQYEFEIMWECQFDKMLTKIQNTETPLIPDILKSNQTERELLNGIREGRLFEYIVADVHTPEHIADKLNNFPPIIKRATITAEHLSEYMKSRIKLEKPNLKKFERETLVQCFNAENHLLMTPLVNFYLNKGLKISNIKKFIQYIPSNCLSPFVKLVTEMRIDAEKINSPTKGNTAKIYGNSGYGKLCERVSNYTKTVLVSNAKFLSQKLVSPLFKSDNILQTEGEQGIHEVVMDDRKLIDDKPVHAGIAILQYSKIMMLEFVDFLREFLIPGSYVFVYTGNLKSFYSKF